MECLLVATGERVSAAAKSRSTSASRNRRFIHSHARVKLSSALMRCECDRLWAECHSRANTFEGKVFVR